jgi:hypothetical protein
MRRQPGWPPGRPRDGLAWWNFAFLATITVMPFTSSLLGEYPANSLAVDIFAVNLLLAVVATRMMTTLGRRWGLLADDIDTRDLGALRVRSAAVLLVIALSIGLAWVNTTAAKYCWVLIPVVQWAAERRSAAVPHQAARPVRRASSQAPAARAIRGRPARPSPSARQPAAGMPAAAPGRAGSQE